MINTLPVASLEFGDTALDVNLLSDVSSEPSFARREEDSRASVTKRLDFTCFII